MTAPHTAAVSSVNIIVGRVRFARDAVKSKLSPSRDAASDILELLISSLTMGLYLQNSICT